MSSNKNLSLKDWINSKGVEEIAKIIGVAESSVRHWRRGHCLPRHEQMQMIVKHSKGAVSYVEMMDTFFSATKKKSNRGARA